MIFIGANTMQSLIPECDYMCFSNSGSDSDLFLHCQMAQQYGISPFICLGDPGFVQILYIVSYWLNFVVLVKMRRKLLLGGATKMAVLRFLWHRTHGYFWGINLAFLQKDWDSGLLIFDWVLYYLVFLDWPFSFLCLRISYPVVMYSSSLQIISSILPRDNAQ